MALNASGAISLAGTTTGQSIELELGGDGTTQISFNDSNVRSLLGISSGAISLFSAYGVSNLPSFAPMIGGTNNGGTTTYATNDKYTFSSDTISAGTNYPTNLMYGIAAGNTSVVNFTNGATTRRLYSYSGDSWSTGSNFSPSPASYGGMISNKTVAINRNNGAVATTQKYTYTSDTVAVATSLTYAAYAGGGCVGNSLQGLWCGGTSTSSLTIAYKTSGKYIYSNDTTAAGGNLTYSMVGGGGTYFMPGIGISTTGIFTGGNDAYTIYGTTQTCVYTYSTDGTVAGTSLAYAVSYSMTGGSTTSGITIGGWTNLQSVGAYAAGSSKYTYSSSAVTTGGSLSFARGGGAGPGATPAAI